MPDFEAERERMVERQIAGRGIEDPRLLEAMRKVPRDHFVPAESAEFAHEDSPLPIEAGQTISQPYIVALMVNAAGIGPEDRVLEVGAGSGYAAAVMAEMAGDVFAIERHEELAALASERLERLGYANARVKAGDGTKGWPEEAPFDAIIASASGPDVPRALLDQLAPGGRLVISVGEIGGIQSLVRIVRTEDGGFEREELLPVRFVPLIGEQGWLSERGGRAEPKALPDLIRAAAEPLPDIDDPAFGALFDRFADAKVVLLGEASHGTSEFYRARAAISKRLIAKHGFNIVAVEADWPDAATIDRRVRHRGPREGEGEAFQRFPTWMWRNAEVEAFVAWLEEHNRDKSPELMAGFYGLDLYNMRGSMRAVIDYLDDVDPDAAATARERYACLAPWSRDPAAYGRMAVSSGFAECEAGVVKMLRELLQKRIEYASADGDEYLDAAQNARLVKNAEAYYRVMYHGAAESWNLRDTHMFETLCALLDAKPGGKAIVWAHNSHIGNAAHTEMGRIRDELNIGQLCRERFGDEAALIGFGTHTGTVAAATDWDGDMEVIRVRPSLSGSYEACSHEAGIGNFLLDLRGGGDAHRDALAEPRLERFIGVIYRPETERWSHYAEASLPGQFDAWTWFDETKAVTPLPGATEEGADETYPFGL